MIQGAPSDYGEFVKSANHAGTGGAVKVLGSMDSTRKRISAAGNHERELEGVPGWVDASLESMHGFDDVEMMCGNLASWMYSDLVFGTMKKDFLLLLATTAEIMRASGYDGPSAGLALTLMTSATSMGIPFDTSAKAADCEENHDAVFPVDEDGNRFLDQTPPAYASLLRVMVDSIGCPASFVIESCVKPLAMAPDESSLPTKHGLFGRRTKLETMTLVYFKSMKPSGDDGERKTDLLPMPISVDTLFNRKRPDIESEYGRGCEWLYKKGDRSS